MAVGMATMVGEGIAASIGAGTNIVTTIAITGGITAIGVKLPALLSLMLMNDMAL